MQSYNKLRSLINYLDLRVTKNRSILNVDFQKNYKDIHFFAFIYIKKYLKNDIFKINKLETTNFIQNIENIVFLGLTGVHDSSSPYCPKRKKKYLPKVINLLK